MAESNALVKAVRLAPTLSGLDRIKALLMGAGYPTVASWMRARGYGESDVWHALRGRRRKSARTREILQALAQDLGKPLSVIERLTAGDAGEDVAESSEILQGPSDTETRTKE